jgi:hypothetical protein
MSTWRVFFYNTRVLYSSETVMMVTPPLIFALLLWRFFGPEEQGTSVAHRGICDNMEHPDIVDHTTYGGGGNFAGRRITNPGAQQQHPEEQQEPKKDR